MKKFKLFITSLFLAMALLFVNISPVRVYAEDLIDGPQGTSQKKAAPPQISPEVIYMIMAAMLWW
jgi:hypothetical protein